MGAAFDDGVGALFGGQAAQIGKTDMPQGWLPELPGDHPWAVNPETADASFPAWLEVRIIDPLLFDPDSPTHLAWAQAYLEKTAALEDGMVTSYVGADSGCP